LTIGNLLVFDATHIADTKIYLSIVITFKLFIMATKKISSKCLLETCESVFCLCLTRRLTSLDKNYLRRYVSDFKFYYNKKQSRPFLYDHIDLDRTNQMFTFWNIYLLMDFFATNGQLLVVVSDADLAAIDSLMTIDDCLISFCSTSPHRDHSHSVLKHFLSIYHHAFYDFSLLDSQDKDSKKRIGLSSINFMGLLHFVALFGPKLRNP